MDGASDAEANLKRWRCPPVLQVAVRLDGLVSPVRDIARCRLVSRSKAEVRRFITTTVRELEQRTRSPQERHR